MTGDEDTALLEPDLEARLRRGLALLAAQTPKPRSSRPWLSAAAAAAVILAAAGIGVGVALSSDDGRTARQQAGQSVPPVVTTPPASGGPTVIGQGVPYDLARLVDESPRIVVGTVTRVTHGEASDASGGLPYVMADVTVDRTLRGPDSSHVVAFDYDYGTTTTTDSGLGVSFVDGERVLLFLSSAEGTVHADLAPPHWQVTGGSQGAYRMRGDEPVAPFTLEQVEQQLRS